MIAGETEALTGIYEHDLMYDNLFGMGKKAKTKKVKSTLTDEQRNARKERRNNTIKDIDNTIRENGGIDGIASSIGNVLGLFKKKGGYQPPADYQVGLGNQPQPEKNKHTGTYIVGGLLAAAVITFGIVKYTKASA